MRITKEQEKILNTFSCQRLTDDIDNKEKIATFVSAKGSALVDYLQQYAWDEDSEGSTAYYVVKNADDEIMLFFSLKCGALFDPLNEAELKEKLARFQELLETIRTADSDGEGKEAAVQLIERIRSGLGMPLDTFRKGIKRAVKQNTKMLQHADADRAQERNAKIVRVGETYPGVELVHFCANDNAKDYWKSCGINRPMGEVLFWRYIASIIFKIQTMIGCQYVFLFAADTSPDRALVNYYEVALRFLQPDDIGTNKPRYDFCCEFMCQKTNDLRENCELYFADFNPDLDEEVV